MVNIMSDRVPTKADLRFFNPERLLEFGIPERCVKCPEINHHLEQHDISVAHTGTPDVTKGSGRYLAERREAEESALRLLPAGCAGCEELTQEELDEFTAAQDELDDYSVEEDDILVGYRCRSTGRAVVAITYSWGSTGLKTIDQSSESRV
jgi:hypothetical protein